MSHIMTLRGCIGDDWRAAVVYAPSKGPIEASGCSTSVLMIGADPDRPYLGAAQETAPHSAEFRAPIECAIVQIMHAGE